VRIEHSQSDVCVALGAHHWRLDITLLAVSGTLLLIGYIMVMSASMHLVAGSGDQTVHYPLNQIGHVLIGLIAAVLMVTIPIKHVETSGQWLFLAGLALLVAVLIPGLGVKVNGSIRWLSIAGFRIQVSEIVKLITVIYMAGYMNRHVQVIRSSIFGMARPLMQLSFAGILLLLEPDFGAAAVILATALALMFLGGARLWQFGLLVCLLVVLGLILIYFSPERMERFTTFWDPWADPLDSGFQLTQSLIAFGRGGWFGVGLGAGMQKLYYLPEGHTDFLFAVIGEELGLAGVFVVIALFALLVWKAFAIARSAEQAGFEFAAYLAYGIGIWFGIQAAINMGVNMGMLPTKGLTLPLMSYGGGSMIVMCCAIGLLLRVHNETTGLDGSGGVGN
jgi:cell division protein FtsW